MIIFQQPWPSPGSQNSEWSWHLGVSLKQILVQDWGNHTSAHLATSLQLPACLPLQSVLTWRLHQQKTTAEALSANAGSGSLWNLNSLETVSRVFSPHLFFPRCHSGTLNAEEQKNPFGLRRPWWPLALETALAVLLCALIASGGSPLPQCSRVLQDIWSHCEPQDCVIYWETLLLVMVWFSPYNTPLQSLAGIQTYP